MLIFNDIQTLGYVTNFNYVGDVFNYNNTSTLNFKGRLQSDKALDSSLNSYFGMAYVNESGLWVPMGGNSSVATGVTPALSGNLYFQGGYAYIAVQDPNFDEIVYTSPSNILYNGDEILFNGFNLIYGSGFGVSGGEYSPLYDIWDGMEAVQDRFSDFQEIYLNGVSVGSGRVTRINFPESKDARVSEYNVEVQLYKSGNLYNLNGQGYSNIDIDDDFCKYVSSLSEDFSFSKNKEGVISYDRSLAFDSINPNISDSLFIDQVKNFASGIIFNDPAFEASISNYPNFYQDQGSRYFTESYNPIKGSFNFSEKFQGPSEGENYVLNRSLSMSLQSEGFSSVSEKGSVLGVRRNLIESAYEGMSQVEMDGPARANEFYSAYVDGSGLCNSGLFLKSKNKVINTERGLIEYSFDYSNDPFSDANFTVERSIQFSKSEAGLYSVSEEGSVKSKNGGTGAERLESAVGYFRDNISGYVHGRLYDTYSGQSEGCGCSGAPQLSDLTLSSNENSYSDFNGLFSYSYVYKNDCTSLIDNAFHVTREKNISDTVHNVFLDVTPYSGEIAQYQNTSSLVKESQTISIVSRVNDKTFDDFVNVAIDSVEIPDQAVYFMNSAQYTFDPDNSKLTMNVDYNYTRYRAYSDYNV